MIHKGDYVILTVNVKNVVKNSVGFVLSIAKTNAKVFFIGKQETLNVEQSKIKVIDVTKTGRPKGMSKEYSTKICNVCHVLKPIEEFEFNQNSVVGKTRRPSCRDCRKNIDGVALKLSEKRRMEAIKPDKFFQCPICGKVSIPNVTANIVIDHNHSTGVARAWICDSCNTGLGRFKDDIELMQSAIKYLKKYGC